MDGPALLNLPPDSELVTDADEEVFILYSNLQQSANSTSSSNGEFRGLGYVDSRTDVLTIQYELQPPKLGVQTAPSGPSKRAHKHVKAKPPEPKVANIQLAQDKTALRSRKGDTGSVVWRASIDFARLILQQLHGQVENPLLKPDLLKDAHVLELGAGTGLLSIAFSPYVSHFTVTDISELLPLIHKNITLNFPNWNDNHPKSPPRPSSASAIDSSTKDGKNITVTELNWLTLQSTLPQHRPRLFPFNNTSTNTDTAPSPESRPVDILLIVDCIYHPSLLPALVETIDYLTIPDHTLAIVVAELRAEDVVREFLSLWLDKRGWTIWRIDSKVLGLPYVMWCGWKTESG
ncbi:hypothetical protein AX16_003271 [Volvariella volvacea WC 439]|nr:hypothetical protein AX16_003271 [Volvariella volvacea WC 439]